MGTPQIEGFTLKYTVPPLWPNYIGKRRTTFGTAYGIKVRCYGEHVGEHIGNLWNILGPDGNPLGTYREHIGNQGRMKKIVFPLSLGLLSPPIPSFSGIPAK
jgi:hypothetical protein